MKILILVIIAFISFCIGRFSHIIGGHLNTPHHWIYGVILLIIGAFFHRQFWGLWLIAFGMGMIISDFKDMVQLKFFGPDELKIKRFWDID